MRMRQSPSLVPLDRLDRDIYLVLEDFGAQAGCAWRETDEQDTDCKTVIRNLMSGQYAYPVRIVVFNAVEGWSRDATSEIADELAEGQARQRAGPASLHRSQRHTAICRSTAAAPAWSSLRIDTPSLSVASWRKKASQSERRRRIPGFIEPLLAGMVERLPRKSD
jgi:hypothetical protein